MASEKARVRADATYEINGADYFSRFLCWKRDDAACWSQAIGNPWLIEETFSFPTIYDHRGKDYLARRYGLRSKHRESGCALQEREI